MPESRLFKRKAGHDVDFFVRAAAGEHQFVGAADFGREPHAPAAQHAAIHKQRHVADVAPPAGERMEIGPAIALTVLEVIILQDALAGLVANRTIDGMPQQ